MAKQSLSVKARLSQHEPPRNEWREKLYTSIISALNEKGLVNIANSEPWIRTPWNQKIQRCIAIGRIYC